MNPTEMLSAAIKSVTQTWISEGLAASGKDIADTSAIACQDSFYQAVLLHLGASKVKEMGVSILSMADLFKPDSEWQISLCRMTIGASCADQKLPDGLCWDDIYDVSAAAGWLESKATWITMSNRHFDAEAPEGVDHIFKLPVFSRDINDY